MIKINNKQFHNIEFLALSYLNCLLVDISIASFLFFVALFPYLSKAIQLNQQPNPAIKFLVNKKNQKLKLKKNNPSFALAIPDDIHLLNIDLIEIWDLQLSTVAQGTSYFKSTSHQVYFGQDEKTINQNQLRDLIITLNQQQGRNDYRRDTKEFQTSNPLLPINEEEEEKQQPK